MIDYPAIRVVGMHEHFLTSEIKSTPEPAAGCDFGRLRSVYLGPGRFQPAPDDSYHVSVHRVSREDHPSFFTVTVQVVANYLL